MWRWHFFLVLPFFDQKVPILKGFHLPSKPAVGHRPVSPGCRDGSSQGVCEDDIMISILKISFPLVFSLANLGLENLKIIFLHLAESNIAHNR